MPEHEDDAGNTRRGFQLGIRFFGQLILWAIIALVGWSFVSIQSYAVSIAILEQRVTTIERTLERMNK